MENITTLYASHPIVAIIIAWIGLEFMAYTVISIAMAWRHLRHSFSWPVRAIRMGRSFF